MRREMESPAGGFLDQVFTAAEADSCAAGKHPAREFAARFAAKEAVVKAMSAGGDRGFFWGDIEVVAAAGARPEVRLSGRARRMADDLGVRRVHLALAHTLELAAASVVLES